MAGAFVNMLLQLSAAHRRIWHAVACLTGWHGRPQSTPVCLQSLSTGHRRVIALPNGDGAW